MTPPSPQDGDTSPTALGRKGATEWRAPGHDLVPAQAEPRAGAGRLLPVAVARDLLPLPPAAARLERLAVGACLVAAQGRAVHRRRALRGDASGRRRVL